MAQGTRDKWSGGVEESATCSVGGEEEQSGGGRYTEELREEHIFSHRHISGHIMLI